ncbi:thiamine pyrophosphate binding domain-containing protein [Fictibacillus macauensis ZFHKF-1]|uniref:Alpha-keto-acid decarboxylase n=1 Tax=Fictibacillus macauensis ZFHKF-1 TaxID=1196324 RepID=I8AKX9_9BACL|nr:thiamine pyrophosphate-binding protein [Fictibacillus macauensis]EIT86492.1 thiamine pyrophosphate binding domain-containing protein [Fictibacillus macauensis ZFHKF-1]
MEQQQSVGDYLFSCLKDEGVTDIFGVPGDYNFSLLDTLEVFEGVSFINSRNELNAGYAADAYARLKGLGALITTFGVGELSACNAIAGAYSEHVGLIHIVGAPKSSIQEKQESVHHTFMNGDFAVFQQTYESLCAYSVEITPKNARLEIKKAIAIAKHERRPVYMKIAIDDVTKTISSRSSTYCKEDSEDPTSLNEALMHIKERLEKAKNPLMLVDMKVNRWGMEKDVLALAEHLQIPVASLLHGKGVFPETHPQFIGMYSGAFGNEEVTHIVEAADCILAIGALWSDVNLAKHTVKIKQENIIDIQPDMIKIEDECYLGVRMDTVVQHMCTWSHDRSLRIAVPPRLYDEPKGQAHEPLQAAYYYHYIQEMIEEGDIIVTETGTFAYGMAEVRLQKDVNYLAQPGWQSIGYATPATFGACIAERDKRVLLFTGDGSLQLTVQEISSMLRNGCTPILFILNNKGYTIEKYLNVETPIQKQPYNDIPEWNYIKSVDFFGGDAFAVQVETNGQFKEAVEAAATLCQEKLCIIEMIITDPLDAPPYLMKMREHLKEQQN